MDQTLYFIEPLDVLFLRGNKLFGDPGSFGESLVPPWPSVAAGALRSAILVHKGHDLARFARGEVGNDPELGTPARPGSFMLTAFTLARCHEDGKVEPLFALPADLVAATREDGDLEVRRLSPRWAVEGIRSSSATEFLAVLSEKERTKPTTGLWLTEEGWHLHLQGRPIEPRKHIVPSSQLWRLDTRVGVGLDPARRRAEDGKLFTVQAVAMRKRNEAASGGPRFGVGFIAAIAGAVMPEQLTLRLGGDGRAALAQRTEATLPEPDYEEIAQARRCRLLLTTPGLFDGGWRPNGISGHGRDLQFNLHDVKARLVCAAVPRAEVISGFDLAAWQPKAAQRAAPTGSVYWLEDLQATAGALGKLAENGLWPTLSENTSRRAEGFNRCSLAAY